MVQKRIKKWPVPAWTIWWFGFGFQLALFLQGHINLLAFITLLATLAGLLCTCAMMIGRPINGLFGLISAVGFIYVNYSAGHFASVLDQFVFVALIDIPLMISWRSWGQNFKSKVRTLSTQGFVITVVSILIAWGVLYELYVLLKDTNPVWDSLVLAIGATASLLCTLHFSNTYTLWLAEDVVNVILWFTANMAGYTQAALPMLVSTILYTATAVYGKFFSVWAKAEQPKPLEQEQAVASQKN
ncbi:hypothetical protein Q757_05455 [Oenococcus alcoholitolerans]|uniref:Nicotinamide mononucleotide transporter n=1 Tax=Oenococcus alcoholitolerans TaxID=931074 RepID=A0ABR4XQV4_9LACO|nr:hypothetical protein Q757_05455 [Oenococcus alcoholitolerans]